MSRKSFEEFIERLTGFKKDESDISHYEKFGNKSKSQQRTELRDLYAMAKQPTATLDLHGSTVAESEKLVKDFCALYAKRTPGATVIIITGRSGRMKKLFPEWTRDFMDPYISGYRCRACGGAWEVNLKHSNNKKRNLESG